MVKRIENEKHFIWMKMPGLDRDVKDYGVSAWIERMQFTPDGVCLLLFHADLFNQHKGMEIEYELPPDICSYYGSARNSNRFRQTWSNFDLRNAIKELKNAENII